ncbi:MAG: PEP-CTERM system histidine kinase PrsK [Burkholderiaceae bacterium]
MLLETFAIASLGICALGYLALFALLVASGRGTGPGRLLLLAVAAEVAWSLLAAFDRGDYAIPSLLLDAVNRLRDLAWIGFVLSILAASIGARADRSRRQLTAAAAGLVAITVTSLVLRHIAPDSRTALALMLLVTVAGLLSVEQLWRNLPKHRRWAMKFLCLALTFKFGYDLVLYSDALMFGHIDAEWWSARGIVNALLVPLIAVTAARNPQWRLEVSVSREIAFHSATLMIVGALLTLIALGGYYLKYFGGSAGKLVATVAVFAALVALSALVGSGSLRARLRVFLAKHFYSYRFDYRREWLRLTHTLASTCSPGSAAPAQVDSIELRALQAIAAIVESPAGALYLEQIDGPLLRRASFGHCNAPSEVAADSPLWRAVEQREWILDASEPGVPSGTADESAGMIGAPEWFTGNPDAWLLVPLMHEQSLVGLAFLTKPLAGKQLNWEIRDLLKAAGHQVASFLFIRRTVEALVQAQQFESFNRMSAFVVHDLKNLVSQLSLLVRNSERHRDNPEFQTDMVETVKDVVGRMQGLLMQLREGPRPPNAASAIRIGAAVHGAIASKGPLTPPPKVEVDDDVADAIVSAHADRLQRVIGHLVQNAVEATPSDGSIRVRARRRGTDAVIEVADNGAGMTEEFLRDGYFKPFATTKANGTGLGAFESRAYIREIGGSLSVESTPDMGTTIRICLPLSLQHEPPAACTIDDR